MKVSDCSTETKAMTFNGKVMGVFERPADLYRFVRAVEIAGVHEVEILEGSIGLHCLMQVKESVEGFLDAILGDMESGMLKVYLQAVEKGASVFAVAATSENRDDIVRTAVQHGARNIAHFGQLVNESFEYLTGDKPA